MSGYPYDRAITPLIDAARSMKPNAAPSGARWLVITTDVIPMPIGRAEFLLKEAKDLAEKTSRSKDENGQPGSDLRSGGATLREQVELAHFTRRRCHSGSAGSVQAVAWSPLEKRVAKVKFPAKRRIAAPTPRRYS